jgi:hypothetical protein
MKQVLALVLFAVSINSSNVVSLVFMLRSVHTIMLWVTKGFGTAGCLFLGYLFIQQSKAPEL